MRGFSALNISWRRTDFTEKSRRRWFLIHFSVTKNKKKDRQSKRIDSMSTLKQSFDSMRDALMRETSLSIRSNDEWEKKTIASLTEFVNFAHLALSSVQTKWDALALASHFQLMHFVHAVNRIVFNLVSLFVQFNSFLSHSAKPRTLRNRTTQTPMTPAN